VLTFWGLRSTLKASKSIAGGVATGTDVLTVPILKGSKTMLYATLSGSEWFIACKPVALPPALEFGHSRAAKRQKNFSLARKRQVNCYKVFKPGTGGRYPWSFCRPFRADGLGPCIPRAYALG
jgi:hypothetical protein